MNAILIAIGDELVSGQTVDTNSAYLARELGMRGIVCRQHWTLGDDRTALAAAIRRAAEQAELVIISGGLGPTVDDVTREALADALRVPLELSAESLAAIEAFFAKRGWPMAKANRSQAMLPAGAEPLPNAAGTAPGIAARLDNATIYAVPGVPNEMQWMFEHRIAPRLGDGHGVVRHHIVHTFGEGESTVGEAIADLMARGANPTIGTTVAGGVVSVRVVTHATDAATADGLAGVTLAEIRRRLGQRIFGDADDTLGRAVGRALHSVGQTLATAESCTGGLIGKLLTDVPGASDYYLGGVVAYANAVKQTMLDVPENLLVAHGAVSEPVAAAMADGCRRRFGTDWAVSVTGIAGPGGSTADKPVGLVYIGVAGPGGTSVQRHVLPGERDRVRLRAALTALNMLRLALRR